MPNFLSWGVDQQSQQFGAFIQMTPRIHQPQPDGTVTVRQGEPKTQHFTAEAIAEKLAVAGPNSKGFWENTSKELPRAQAMHENKADLFDEPDQGDEPELGLKHQPVLKI